MKRFMATPLLAALAVATLVFGTLDATAQRGQRPGTREGTQGDRAGGQRGQRGQRGDRFQRGNFDPEQMRARMAEMRDRMIEGMREPLDVSDEEWTAIKPLVAKVVEKQSATRTRGFRGMFGGRGMTGRRGGPDREGDRRGPTETGDPELDALIKALDSKDTPAKDIEAKLKALRDARKKAEAELQQARDDLRKVLTVRQEAQLVLRGILD